MSSVVGIGTRNRRPHTVGDVMQRQVATVDANDSVAAARSIMEAAGVDQLTVLDRGRVLGLVSRRDLRRALDAASAPYTELENRWFGNARVAGSIPVRAAVTSPPLVAPPNRVACEAARSLADTGARCVIVVEQGTVVGVAGLNDLPDPPRETCVESESWPCSLCR